MRICNLKTVLNAEVAWICVDVETVESGLKLEILASSQDEPTRDEKFLVEPNDNQEIRTPDLRRVLTQPINIFTKNRPFYFQTLLSLFRKCPIRFEKIGLSGTPRLGRGPINLEAIGPLFVHPATRLVHISERI